MLCNFLVENCSAFVSNPKLKAKVLRMDLLPGHMNSLFISQISEYFTICPLFFSQNWSPSCSSSNISRHLCFRSFALAVPSASTLFSLPPAYLLGYLALTFRDQIITSFQKLSLIAKPPFL